MSVEDWVITQIAISLGGKGSGNFKHKGRPGQVGGSADDGIPNASAVSRRKFQPGDKEAIKADVNDEFEGWAEEINGNEEADFAVEWYSDEGYGYINEYLRHGSMDEVTDWYFEGDPDDEWYYDEAEDQMEIYIGDLDHTIATSPGFDRDTILYRGLGYDPELEVGDEFTDSGFISTSLDRDEAVPFTTQYMHVDAETNWMAEIVWPAKKPVAYMPLVVSKHTASEMEALLPRDTTFKVIGFYDDTVLRGNRRIKIRMIQMELAQ